MQALSVQYRSVFVLEERGNGDDIGGRHMLLMTVLQPTA